MFGDVKKVKDTVVCSGSKNAEVAVILFHGYGDNADNFSQLAPFLSSSPEVDLFFPQGTLSLGMGGYGWFNLLKEDFERLRQQGNQELLERSFEQDEKNLQKLLEAISKYFSTKNYKHIVLGGFSQGVSAALYAIDQFPITRSLILFSGAALRLEEKFRSGFDPTAMPVFLSHGRSDEVLPFFWGEQLHDFFLSKQMDVKWYPFSGSHEIPPSILAQANHFLMDQIQSSFQK